MTDMDEGSDSATRKQSRRKRRRRPIRIIFISALVLLALLLLGAGWVGIRGWLAKGELEAAIPLADSIKTKLAATDTAGAESDAAELAQRARDAAGLTSDPVWGLFEHLPFAGPNLVAVRESAQVVDSIASGAIAPVVRDSAAVGAQGFRPVNGSLDLAPLVAAQPTISAASDVLGNAAQRVSAIDVSSTIEPVRDAVQKLSDATHEADSLLDGVNKAVTLAPRILGNDGARKYLLAFQNPAELRSGGGITSALALIGTDKGTVSLLQQASGASFEAFRPPAVELSPDVVSLFGERPAIYVQNTTLVPDFAVSGRIASTMWTKRFGDQVDGVISFDPVALSYLLQATGPVTLPTGDVINSNNAVQFLLEGVYSKYPEPEAQDAVFASAAKSVFDRISSGDLDPKLLLASLIRSGDEGRLRLWSAHEEDQQVVSGTTLVGSLPQMTETGTGLGIYFNDATASKMDYYLRTEVAASTTQCNVADRPSVNVSISLKNDAPLDAATALPRYVTGGGVFGVTPGHIKTVIYIYVPSPVTSDEPVEILGLNSGEATDTSFSARDGDHLVLGFTVELAPGESRVVSADVLLPPGAPAAIQPTITPSITPTVYSSEINQTSPAC